VRAKELTIKFSYYRPDDRSSGSIYNDFKYGECMDYSVIIPKDEWGDYENLDSEGKSYGPGGSENIGRVSNGCCIDINIDVSNDLF